MTAASDTTLRSHNPFTNVVGVARSLLALGTLLTLLCNDLEVLFSPGGRSMAESAVPFASFRWGLFYLLRDQLPVARWIAVAILVPNVLGLWPRVFGVLHWWVAFSFTMACIPMDGGDQVCAVLTLLLLPVVVLDPRRSHFEAPPTLATFGSRVRARVALSAIYAIRVQAALIYFHAGVAKLEVKEWVNGTALYYWFLDPVVGLPSWVHPWAVPMLANPWLVTLATWSVLVLEVLLFLGLVIDKRLRGPLLAAGIAFHLGILVVHGLVSFFCSMCAVLVLLLRPHEQLFAFPLPWQRARSVLRRGHPLLARWSAATRPSGQRA